MIVLGLVMFAACSQAGEVIGEDDLADVELAESDVAEKDLIGSELAESEWVLISLDGEPLLEGTNITLVFYPAEISGFAGCNGYGGPIEFHEKDEINVVEIASQAEGCMEPEGVLE